MTKSDDQIVYLRFQYDDNKKRPPIKTNAHDWILHPDASIDVAVLPFEDDPHFLHNAILINEPSEIEAGRKSGKWNIDIGTDVFVVGLFTRHVGQGPNILPILRTGTIARICNDKERFRRRDGGGAIKGHLLELHSIGGLSGSPVLACPMDISNKGLGRIALQTAHIWIGLISGHWSFDEDEDYNSGIAIMSSNEFVVEIVKTHPDLIKMRDEKKQIDAQKNGMTLDDAGEPLTQKTRAPKKEDRIDIAIPTRGQFERDLAKAIRKRGKK